MEVALDVSAGTGKSLETVTQAMGRALNGSNTALNRLVPSLKNSKNPMEDLAAAFKGANEEASKQKTWERFSIIMGNLQEMIGDILLPILEDFGAWFTKVYPEIQDFFRKLKKTFDDPAVQQSFNNLRDAIGRLGKTLRNLFGLTDSKEADDFVAFFTTVADVLTIITEAINVLAKALKTSFPGLRLADIFGNIPQWLVDTVQRPSTGDVVTPGSQLPNSSARSGGSKTYNINIGGSNVSAQEIVNKIAQLERSQGRKYLA
jgi:phage-related protein